MQQAQQETAVALAGAGKVSVEAVQQVRSGVSVQAVQQGAGTQAHCLVVWASHCPARPCVDGHAGGGGGCTHYHLACARPALQLEQDCSLLRTQLAAVEKERDALGSKVRRRALAELGA